MALKTENVFLMREIAENLLNSKYLNSLSFDHRRTEFLRFYLLEHGKMFSKYNL